MCAVKIGRDAALLVGPCWASSSVQQKCKFNWEKQQSFISHLTPRLLSLQGSNDFEDFYCNMQCISGAQSSHCLSFHAFPQAQVLENPLGISRSKEEGEGTNGDVLPESFYFYGC